MAMLWAALLPDPSPCTSPPTDALRGVATWALQFSPRVAVVESSAVLLEVSGSTRLFGGRRKLAERLASEAAELGLRPPSWAPTSLAALGLARAGRRNGVSRPLQEVVDRLPLASLAAAAAHEPMLARLGCRCLGDVRALPRGGLSRRFGAPLLEALDQAYGLRPDNHDWEQLPDTFTARLELHARVEQAPALLFGARRLLLQLCGWLQARRSGITAFVLRWAHDAMRSRAAGEGGELTVRTAEITRDVEHLTRLLGEHLAHVQLSAPVGDLVLQALEVHPLDEKSAALLPDPGQDGEALGLVLERIAARLGAERVLRPVAQADHRMEAMAHWQPASLPMPRSAAAPSRLGLPQPSFLLPEPLKLAARQSRPLYQGPLLLLMGPQRVESGWWDRKEDGEGRAVAQTAVRDYWVALSPHAGVLYIYQTRLQGEGSAWFLHGVFA